MTYLTKCIEKCPYKLILKTLKKNQFFDVFSLKTFSLVLCPMSSTLEITQGVDKDAIKKFLPYLLNPGLEFKTTSSSSSSSLLAILSLVSPSLKSGKNIISLNWKMISFLVGTFFWLGSSIVGWIFLKIWTFNIFEITFWPGWGRGC